MSWFPAILPTLTALALLLLPGASVLLAGGVERRLMLLAPAISTGLIGGSAVVWGFLGWAWGPGAVALTALAATVIAALLRWRRPLPLTVGVRPGDLQIVLAVLVGLLVGGVVLLRVYASVVPGPEAIGQLQDTMFHIDVVRYIIDGANGSSLQTGYMDGSAEASGFYPAGWHDVAALVVLLTGCSIPMAATAMTAAITVVVFPASMLLLTTTLFGTSARLALATMIGAQVVGAFPWRYLSWGQLYSNLLAMALLPALIAALVLLFRTWTDLRPHERALRIVLILCALGGTALAQPNTVFALIVFGALFLIGFVGGREARAAHGLRRAVAGTAAVIVGTGLAWVALYVAPFMQRTVTWVWNSFETPAQAFGEVALLGLNGGVGQPLVAALALIGAVVAWRSVPSARWFVAAGAAFAVLYMLAAGLEGWVRDFLTGFWYHDSYRLAALVALVASGLVALAIDRIWASASDRLRDARGRILLGAVALAAFAVVLLGPGLHQQREWIRASFQTEDAWMLSPGEQSFLDEVETTIADDAVVLNNPYDGSGLGYGLNGIDMLFPAMDGNWLGTWDERKRLIASSLSTDGLNPEQCAALDNFDVEYLVQLDDRPYSAAGTGPEWSGLRVAPGTDGFETVLVDGERSLLRIVGCD